MFIHTRNGGTSADRGLPCTGAASPAAARDASEGVRDKATGAANAGVVDGISAGSGRSKPPETGAMDKTGEAEEAVVVAVVGDGPVPILILLRMLLLLLILFGATGLSASPTTAQPDKMD